jgi:hypothetical protein
MAAGIEGGILLHIIDFDTGDKCLLNLRIQAWSVILSEEPVLGNHGD